MKKITINVNEDVHRKLVDIKYNHHFEDMSDTVEYLIKETEKK